MLESVPELRAFGNEIKERFDFAVVCGMGGSSLAPDILADTFGQYDGWPELLVLDSTCPAANPRARRTHSRFRRRFS